MLFIGRQNNLIVRLLWARIGCLVRRNQTIFGGQNIVNTHTHIYICDLNGGQNKIIFGGQTIFSTQIWDKHGHTEKQCAEYQ